ncbi:hypothetical protein FGG08_005924 [Glutinoglossum americanum]|uniref:Arginase-like protein n=1 Tax=Glutinoglossum americanum TaxID=1670608 RepID=A0A9P8I6A9_9PEZI|nr:hypothetical protein FGG08_005924 [Glutinoglossum americanum]
MAEVMVVRRKYHWPEIQLNVWLIVMLVSASTVLGIFANFINVQQQLGLGVPWYMPYWVVSGALAIAFLILILWLVAQRKLLPGIVILGSFILFVLWLTGLIKSSIVLWGPQGSVNDNCMRYVQDSPSRGQSINTLAWLEQNSICQSWKAAFSFELIGTVFLLWMMIMAWNVHRDDY